MLSLCVSLTSPARNSSSAADMLAGLVSMMYSALHITCCVAPVGGCVLSSTNCHNRFQHAKSITVMLSHTSVNNEPRAAVYLAVL